MSGIHLAMCNLPAKCGWIDAVQAFMQSAVILRCNQVGFGQQKAIRNGCLFDCLGILIECVLCGYPVNRDDYAIQSIAVCQRGFCHQCMDDRRRVCQPSGFDQHPPELTFAITCKTPCNIV